MERILCAAIHYTNIGKPPFHSVKNNDEWPGVVICGWRHHNCISTWKSATGFNTDQSSVQGFLTSENRFVNRKEAGKIAFVAGQITIETDCLFSEDLY